MNDKDALVEYLILQYMLEQYNKGNISVCLADVFSSFGMEPPVDTYDVYYELTEKFFEEQHTILANFEQGMETRH